MIEISLSEAKILLYTLNKFYNVRGSQTISRNEIINQMGIEKCRLSRTINNKYILENKIKEKDEK